MPSGEAVQKTGEETQTADRVLLRILATTDLHAYLLPYDYYTDRRDDRVGLVRTAGLIALARASTPNCLLLDNGDTLQGAPLGDVAVTELLPAGHMHPMIAAMNAIGFDAATVGNHDFDYGREVLESCLADADFPVVLANADRSDGTPLLPRRTILDRVVLDEAGRQRKLRVGITGIVPPQVAKWNRSVLGGSVTFSDSVDAVRREAEALRADGADIVVVLAHAGLGVERPARDVAPGTENTGLALTTIPGVTAVIAGHTHVVYARDAGSEEFPDAAPVVQPGYWGSHLGCIDLTLVPGRTLEGKTAWNVVKSEANAYPVATTAAKERSTSLRNILRAFPRLKSHLRVQHRATTRFTSKTLGQTALPLTTHFSFVAPCAATQLIANAQRLAAEDLIGSDPGLRDMRLLVSAAPFRAGGRTGATQFTDVPAGPLKLRHAHDLYPYPNRLVILKMTGRKIIEWAERAASIYHQIDPADPAPQILVDPQFAAYNFDRIDGLMYDIDVSKPAWTNAAGDEVYDYAGRVHNVRYADGTPVSPEDEALVVTNSYRAAGGGYFGMCATSEAVRTSLEPVRDHIVRFITSVEGPIHPTPSPTFNLTGFGKAEVVFRTGAGAMRYPDLAAELGLTPRTCAADPADPPGLVYFTLAT